MDHDTWQWQQPDTVWKGTGLYHVTMVVPSHQPLFGELVIPNDDPLQAFVKRTDLGDAVIDRLLRIPKFYPEVQVLHFCLMPNHLHAILYVRRAMKKGISSVITGFWRVARTLSRAYSYLSSTVTPADYRFYTNPALLRTQVGNDAFYALSPVFTDQPFLRPMTQYRQLPTAIRYLDMNPARLATKRLKLLVLRRLVDDISPPASLPLLRIKSANCRQSASLYLFFELRRLADDISPPAPAPLLFLFFELRRQVADILTLAPSFFFALRRLVDDIPTLAQDLFFVLRRLVDGIPHVRFSVSLLRITSANCRHISAIFFRFRFKIKNYLRFFRKNLSN